MESTQLILELFSMLVIGFAGENGVSYERPLFVFFYLPRYVAIFITQTTELIFELYAMLVISSVVECRIISGYVGKNRLISTMKALVVFFNLVSSM